MSTKQIEVFDEHIVAELISHIEYRRLTPVSKSGYGYRTRLVSDDYDVIGRMAGLWCFHMWPSATESCGKWCGIGIATPVHSHRPCWRFICVYSVKGSQGYTWSGMVGGDTNIVTHKVLDSEAFFHHATPVPRERGIWYGLVSVSPCIAGCCSIRMAKQSVISPTPRVSSFLMPKILTKFHWGHRQTTH